MVATTAESASLHRDGIGDRLRCDRFWLDRRSGPSPDARLGVAELVGRLRQAKLGEAVGERAEEWLDPAWETTTSHSGSTSVCGVCLLTVMCAGWVPRAAGSPAGPTVAMTRIGKAANASKVVASVAVAPGIVPSVR